MARPHELRLSWTPCPRSGVHRGDGRRGELQGALLRVSGAWGCGVDLEMRLALIGGLK
jgi:hypothetical protein